MVITASRVVIPLLSVGALLLYRDHPVWALVLASVGILLAVAGGSWRSTPRLRAGALPTALLLAATAALLLAGWWSGAAVFYVAGATVLAISVGRRASLAALALAIAIQAGYGLLVLSRRAPPVDGGSMLSLTTVATSLTVTLIAGGLLVAMVTHLATDWTEAVGNARKETQEARDSGEQLAARIEAMLATHRTVQHRTSYLEASLAATRQLSVPLGLGELLDRAAVAAASHFDFDEAQVYLLDSAGEWATLVSTSRPGGEDPVAHGYRLRADSDTLVGWVAANRQAQVVYAGASAVDRGRPSHIAQGGHPRAEVALALPLETGGQILGVLLLMNGREGVVSRDDLGVLEAFADYLARLIDHARDLRDEAAASEAGGPFLGTANLLAIARTEADVYDVILDVLRDAGPARMLIVRSVGGNDALRVALDYQGQRAERVQMDLTDLSPPSLVDLALVGLSLESPLWAEDLTNLDPSLSPELGRALRDLADTSRSAGLALIPMRAEATRVEGEIVVLYGKAHRFSIVERRLHQLLADFGGSALERTRLLAEAQGRLDQAQQRSVIETRIARAADVETILKVALRELARTLRAADAEIRFDPGAGASVGDGQGQVESGSPANTGRNAEPKSGGRPR